jgi:hypothetical protein
MYESARAAGGQQQAGPQGGPSTGDQQQQSAGEKGKKVEDADFEVVDDK